MKFAAEEDVLQTARQSIEKLKGLEQCITQVGGTVSE